MAKIEAFDDSYFMHQIVRVCHTDHPDSIVSSMACTVDLKISFYITGKSHCYSIGMAKIVDGRLEPKTNTSDGRPKSGFQYCHRFSGPRVPILP